MSRIEQINDENWLMIQPMFEYLEIPKSGSLLEAGKPCKYISFIVEGCLRIFIHHDGKEVTRQIFFENAFVTELSSFTAQVPSQYDIDALENTRLLNLSYENINTLYAKSPAFLRLGKTIAEQTASFLIRRNVEMVTDSARQRYDTLIKERPKVIQRVPQHIIASYLGITPQALSRLRAQR